MSNSKPFLFLCLNLALASAAFAADPAPICDRVSVSIRADDGQAGDMLKAIEPFILRKLKERGYTAKYVSFSAPGEAIPPSNESEILTEARDRDRILIEIEYSDLLLQQNLGMRIYKLEPAPPYHNQPYYDEDATIGPLKLLGTRMKDRFRQLVRSKKMIDCSDLAEMTAPIQH